jgi:hypothetical protein
MVLYFRVRRLNESLIHASHNSHCSDTGVTLENGQSPPILSKSSRHNFKVLAVTSVCRMDILLCLSGGSKLCLNQVINVI